MQPEQDLINKRLEKLRKLYELGVNPYPYSYTVKDFSVDIIKRNSKLKHNQKSKKKVRIAGRIIALRSMGKVSFGNILDSLGKIQFYIREEDNFDQYKIFENFDIGDMVGIEGFVFKTKKGEISVWVKKIDILCKSLRPLPEKWHGLKDMETKYRQRYLDLIANPETKEVFLKRSRIILALREFMEKKGFLEVDTPILQPIYGGGNARPFKTMLQSLHMPVYLRISDELYLKRLIVGGFDKVYEIGRDFRNEDIDRTHNPEFSMMECYWAYADYHDIMQLTEDLYKYILKKVFGTLTINYWNKKIDFGKKWKKITMIDSLKEYAGIDVTKMSDEELRKFVEHSKIELSHGFTRGRAIFALFETFVEEKLIQPTFIIDFPKETTPLCKTKRDNPELIERFELFINGWEMANAYSELNDAILQRKLLEEQATLLGAGDEEAHPMDEDFIKAIEHGMPPTGGLGIGVDRMIILLTNSYSIRDVLLFPFMKSEEKK